jgi:undecaprenyl-phosphate 4-deoxy-4-formamido-L-arabinose transferase
MLGFAFTLFGAGVLLYVIVRYLLGESDVRGFTFLAATIAIFSGVQLFALGIFGEYLSRMHFRLMDRPSYQVRSRTKGDGPRRRKVDPR